LRDAQKNGEETLPYVGTALSDLTFIGDGNPDTKTVDNRQLINFVKHRLLFQTIQEFCMYQDTKREEIEAKEPLYTYLYELPALDESSLYSLSLEREPRESKN